MTLAFTDGLDTNLPRHPKTGKMFVVDAALFQKSLKPGLMKFRTKPADWILSNIDKGSDPCFLEGIHDFVKPSPNVAQGKEIGVADGTRFIPKFPRCHLLFR